ncbi:MAG: hypothetical protein KGJ96_02560, partial [Xanthomonadaceae bacterium]|nr:hypothetical protein [Xanthomonadaceae bacterium]
MNTTAAVATPQPSPAAPRAASAIDFRPPGDEARRFDRQLDTARQQLDPQHPKAPAADSRAPAAGQPA